MRQVDNEGCPECIGGYVFSVEGEGFKKYTYVYRCATCHPDEPETYPYQSARYLRARNIIHPIHDLQGQKMSKSQAMERLNSIGKSFELPF